MFFLMYLWIDRIKNMLENALDSNMVEKVTFHQCRSVDRCNLEALQKSSSEFIHLFCNKLSLLVHHDVIAKQQTSFMNCTREKLNKFEFRLWFFWKLWHCCAKWRLELLLVKGMSHNLSFCDIFWKFEMGKLYNYFLLLRT